MSNLKNVLKKIIKILAKAKDEKSLEGYSLIGGFAVSARARPRATRDIDFLIEAKSCFYTDSLPDLLKNTGYSFKIFTSNFSDPLHKLVRIYDKEENEIVDLIPVFWKWQQEVIQNSEEIEIAPKVIVPIAQAEDLIVLKLKAAGPQDLVDIQNLLDHSQIKNPLNEKRIMALAKRAKVDKKLKKLLKQ